MNNLFKSIRQTTRLYKQPARIGDVIEHRQKRWVVISIQEIKILHGQLSVLYICQNLEEENMMVPTRPSTPKPFQLKAMIQTGIEKNVSQLPLGRMVWHENRPYQCTEYLDITIDFTDIIITFAAKPLYPISTELAKEKLKDHHKKKIKLSIVPTTSEETVSDNPV
ncbi:hypothetical protein CN918_31855 [Priestia megaterium]|nr:hypothetical protein CN918_31855 [Priestia megaterium]